MRRLRQRLTQGLRLIYGRFVRLLIIGLVLWIMGSLILAMMAHEYGRRVNHQEADVLIVLGSGMNRNATPGDALTRRAKWAAQAWQEGIAPYVICTGGYTRGIPRSEADGCREVLEREGVPAAAIFLEDRSRSTEENALYSREIMQAQGWESAVVVTDAFHMLRAHWIFTSAGIPNVGSPVPQSWVRTGWYVQLLGREVLAIQWQVFKTALNLPVTYVPVG
jgi:uncharacterized SAM-binding protein YcdF (DUF218 family)